MIKWLLNCRSRQAAGMAIVVLLTVPAGVKAEDVPIRVTLDRAIDGTAAPFLSGQRGKYYRREHLDVSVVAGSGSYESIERVASGEYQFGVADVNQLVRYLGRNPDGRVQAVMMLEDRPAFAVIGRKSRGVIAPKDLEDKTLGVTPPDPAFAHWPEFARANGIDAERVRLDSRGYVLREAGLAQGRVDAIIGRSHTSPGLLKQMGVADDDITIIPMTTGGLDLLGNALIVNLDFAEKNPDVVKGFVRATLRGFFDVIADPVAHADDVLHYNDAASRATEIERIERFLNGNAISDWVRSHGLGGVDMERLTRSIAMLQSTYDLETVPAPERVFSWGFLPPEEERKIAERTD